MDINNDYGILEVQKELLELLTEFDLFCTQNDINYSVIGGTLLGAIRHHGFIPWDDDLDVFVDRANYIKFINCLPYSSLEVDNNPKSKFWVDKLRLRNKENDEFKVFLDLFILDNLPDNRMAAFLKLTILRFLQGIIKPHPKFSNYSFLYKIISIILWTLGRMIPKKTKLRLYSYISKWGNGNVTKYKTISNDEFGLLAVKYPYDIMESTKRLRFENIEVSGISKYHEYLCMMYGDYMTPPEVSKRIPNHSI